MVVFGRHIRRIVLVVVAPGVADVHIDRVAVAVKFPHGGHIKLVPALVVKILFPEICGSAVQVAHPVEFPWSVKAHEVRAFFFGAGGGCIGVFVGEISRVHRQTVDRVDIGVLPLFEGLPESTGGACAHSQSG